MNRALQSINLYPSAMRPVTDYLSASKVWVYIALLTSILCVFYIFQWQGLENQRSALKTSKIKNTAMQNSLTVLQESLPAGEKQRLEMLLKNQQLRLSKLQKRKQQLKYLGVDRELLFSQSLDTLALSNLGKLSLEAFQIQAQSRTFSLKGIAKNAASVPAYVDRVKQNSTVDAINFNGMTLKKSDLGVSFLIGNPVFLEAVKDFNLSSEEVGRGS